MENIRNRNKIREELYFPKKEIVSYNCRKVGLKGRFPTIISLYLSENGLKSVFSDNYTESFDYLCLCFYKLIYR